MTTMTTMTTTMMTALAIALAAAIGAPARYLLDRWVTRRTMGRAWGSFPWGLLVVNALGSLVAGLALTLASSTAQTVLLVGLCGAFTTFSGFGWDLLRLWGQQRGAFWAALGIMPAACIAAFGIGWAIGSGAAAAIAGA